MQVTQLKAASLASCSIISRQISHTEIKLSFHHLYENYPLPSPCNLLLLAQCTLDIALCVLLGGIGTLVVLTLTFTEAQQ